MHVALRRTIKPVAGAPVVDIGPRARARARAASVANFHPCRSVESSLCFRIRRESALGERHHPYIRAVRVCSSTDRDLHTDAGDELIVGDRYRHKGRRCRL